MRNLNNLLWSIFDLYLYIRFVFIRYFLTVFDFFLNILSLEKVLLVMYIFFTPFWIRARIIEEVTPPAPIIPAVLILFVTFFITP